MDDMYICINNGLLLTETLAPCLGMNDLKNRCFCGEQRETHPHINYHDDVSKKLTLLPLFVVLSSSYLLR